MGLSSNSVFGYFNVRVLFTVSGLLENVSQFFANAHVTCISVIIFLLLGFIFYIIYIIFILFLYYFYVVVLAEEVVEAGGVDLETRVAAALPGKGAGRVKGADPDPRPIESLAVGPGILISY